MYFDLALDLAFSIVVVVSLAGNTDIVCFHPAGFIHRKQAFNVRQILLNMITFFYWLRNIQLIGTVIFGSIIVMNPLTFWLFMYSTVVIL